MAWRIFSELFLTTAGTGTVSVIARDRFRRALDADASPLKRGPSFISHFLLVTNLHQRHKPQFAGEWVRLGDLCTKGKSSLRQKDLKNDGPYLVYGASGVVGTSSEYQNEEPYVAVVKDGAGVGRVMACEPHSSVLGTMQALLPNETTDRDYLLHLVESLKLGQEFTGSTIPHIYFKDYGKTPVKALTIAKQTKVASALNQIDRLVGLGKQQLSALDDLAKSEFVEMFEGVDKVVELGEVCKFVSGKSLPKEIELPNGDCLYAKVGDLNLDGNERLITRSRTYVSFESAKGSLIPSGAVVFPKRGGAIGTNKKRITALNCCLDLNLMAVIPSSLVATEYLYWFFRLIDLNKIANGSTVPQINNKDLRPLRFPLPPLALQQQFADFVAEVDKLRFDVQQQIEKLEALKQSLMQDYFG